MKRWLIIVLILALSLSTISCTNLSKDNDKADTKASSTHPTESAGDSFNTTTDNHTVGTEQAYDTDAVTIEETSGTTVTQPQTNPPTVTTRTETGTEKKPPEETSSSAVASATPAETQAETDKESLPVVTNSDGVDLPLDVFD